MSIRISDLTIHESLTIVEIGGFKPAPEMATDDEGNEHDVSGIAIDPPGSANWLCEQFGMDSGEFEGPGILWQDYDMGGNDPWGFTVLIATDKVEDLKKFAQEAGYDVRECDEVAGPIRYGDGSGTVEILKHRDGWIIIDN